MHLETILADAAAITLPILAAALGGLFTSAAGSLNVALEGLIVAGAFSFGVAADASGSIFLGTLTALACSIALALLVAAAEDRLSANVFVAALAVNLLVAGGIGLLAELVFGTKGVVPLPATLSGRIDAGALSGLPVIGPVLFRQRGATYLLAAACAAAVVVYKTTPFGLRVRAAGMNEGSLRITGVDPRGVRYLAFAMSGAACALAGVVLARSVGAWVPNIASGRGWIALAAIFLGGRRPGGIVVATMAFGLLLALSNAAQATLAVPAELVLALPYAATAAAALLGRARRHG
ncbi:MAG TPA: hypothetical protein VLH39_02355 [Magnetospirillaceae bacterium]|nr:hypothetical protein [Magnetospirillaceae bacterium]